MSLTNIKNSAILSGFKQKGKITDQRLSFLTKIIFMKYHDKAEDYGFMVEKLKEHFDAEVTTGRLHVFYKHQEEEEDRKLTYKHVV